MRPLPHSAAVSLLLMVVRCAALWVRPLPKVLIMCISGKRLKRHIRINLKLFLGLELSGPALITTGG